MYFSLQKHSHVRLYGDVGYIVSPKLLKSHVFNKTGAIFLSVLTHEKQDIEILSQKISIILQIRKNIFFSDLCDFYRLLLHFGYLESDITPPVVINNREIFTAKSNSDDFLSNIPGYSPILKSSQIEITSICNERCIHCYIPHEQKLHYLPYNDIKNILDQLQIAGCLSITLSGGEVFTHPDISKVLELLQNYDFSISILTNLTLITDEIISLLKKLDIDKIHVSVYSLKPAVHDYITQVNGSLQKTLQNIKLCLNNSIPIKISCPTMKANYKDFEELLLWGKKNNIQVLTDFNLMARNDNTTDNLEQRLSEEEAAVVIKAIIQHDESYQKLIKDNNKSSIIDINAPICHVGQDKICISSTGDLFPCPGWQGMVIGNIYQNTIMDIWKNSEKLNWLRSLKRKDIPKCLDCDSKDYCLLCIQRNFNETRYIFTVPPHFCKTAALNKHLVSVYKNEI